jgi:hypothetical protein
LYDRKVAGQFAFPTEASVGKPNRGVKEHDSASDCRQTVPQVVTTPDVGEFVSQNVSQLAGIQERDQLGW